MTIFFFIDEQKYTQYSFLIVPVTAGEENRRLQSDQRPYPKATNPGNHENKAFDFVGVNGTGHGMF
jgi:hypothetical protein